MNILRKIREVDRALNEGLITYQEAADAVAPFTDAEPVKHGYWIDTNEGTYCSECRNYPYDDGEFHILHWRSDYCPVCGAKMDKVKNE